MIGRRRHLIVSAKGVVLVLGVCRYQHRFLMTAEKIALKAALLPRMGARETLSREDAGLYSRAEDLGCGMTVGLCLLLIALLTSCSRRVGVCPSHYRRAWISP